MARRARRENISEPTGEEAADVSIIINVLYEIFTLGPILMDECILRPMRNRLLILILEDATKVTTGRYGKIGASVPKNQPRAKIIFSLAVAVAF